MEAKGNILVVDDELGIREGCRRALAPQGFTVETAATLQEGLQKIHAGDFDLVLLDVMMPDGRGIDLLAPIHDKDPETVCVIITGYATVELAVKAIKQGAYDFVSKPFTADVLVMTVDQALEKRRLSLEAKRLQAIEREAAELSRAKEEMERLDRFKTSFMLMVAHELRAPVAAAQSLLRTLVRGLAGDLTERQKQILNRVEARLEALTELINDLLSLAASKTVEVERPLERLALQPVIRTVIDRFSVEADSKRIELSYRAPDDPIEVIATEDGLEKILGNLIGNAIKYTPGGGRVRVEVEARSDDVSVAVSDNGIGIPVDDLPHLCDEFFRARNARHAGIIGTGLGLSIVKGYVDRFGGHIDVHSVEGEGSTFKVTLPTARQPLTSLPQGTP